VMILISMLIVYLAPALHFAWRAARLDRLPFLCWPNWSGCAAHGPDRRCYPFFTVLVMPLVLSLR